MAEEKTRRIPWTKVILFVSLALNLAVAGLVIGAVSHDRRGGERGPGLRDAGFGPYASALTRGDRLKLGLTLRREDGPFYKRRAEMQAAFDTVLTALRAEPYDHAAVVAAIAEQEALVGQIQSAARDVLLAHVETMETSERMRYADALEDWRKRRGPSKRRDK